MTSTRLTLHIGYHKTGSTSLQTMLLQHQDYLLSHGVYLPKSGRPSSDRMIHSNIGWEARNTKEFNPNFGTLQDLWDEVSTVNSIDQILISDEGLSRLEEPQCFLEKLPFREVKVLAYTRKLETLAASLYCEVLKFGKAQTFNEFVVNPTPILFHQELSRRWREATPKFVSHPIEDFQEGRSLAAHFFGELGVPLAENLDVMKRANSRISLPEAFTLFLSNNLMRSERSGLPGSEIKRYRELCRKKARLGFGNDVPRFALTEKESTYGSQVLGLKAPMHFDASRSSFDSQLCYEFVIDSFFEVFNRKPSWKSIQKLRRRAALFLNDG